MLSIYLVTMLISRFVVALLACQLCQKLCVAGDTPEPEFPQDVVIVATGTFVNITNEQNVPLYSAFSTDENGFESFDANVAVEGYTEYVEYYIVRVSGYSIFSKTYSYTTTADGTATPGNDFAPQSGTLILPAGGPGTRTETVKILILNDNINEEDETFSVKTVGLNDVVFTIRDTLRTSQTNSIEPYEVENLILTGSDNIDGTGNSGSNNITGNVGNNALIGLEGDDTLIGYGSEKTVGEVDYLTGGPGKDKFYVDSYNDGIPQGPLEYTVEQVMKIFFPPNDKIPVSSKAKSKANIQKYLPSLNREMQTYDINTVARQQHFISQIGHEAGRFKYADLEEDWENTPYQCNYDPCPPCQKGQDPIKDKCYKCKGIQCKNIDKCKGKFKGVNGNKECGDGYRFRGRGFIQLTGRYNYEKYGKLAGLDLISSEDAADAAANYENAAKLAGAYWKENVKEWADTTNVEEVTKRVNGKKMLGLEDRKKLYKSAQQYVGPFNDNDYAVITDFSPEDDKIKITGNQKDYNLYTQVVSETESRSALCRGDEVIAFIEGKFKSLSLDGSYFQYT